MSNYRIVIKDTGILGKTSTTIIEFSATDDAAAGERYTEESKSCDDFNDIEYGFMRAEGLYRVDQSEVMTRLP